MTPSQALLTIGAVSAVFSGMALGFAVHDRLMYKSWTAGTTRMGRFFLLQMIVSLVWSGAPFSQAIAVAEIFLLVFAVIFLAGLADVVVIHGVKFWR